jgi:hypothetical protein
VALRAIHEQNRNIQLLKLFYLVRHQGNKGRYDHGEPVQGNCGKLEAQTLAAAGRHHAHHIVAAQDILNNLALMGAELRKLKDPPQEIVNTVHRTTPSLL